MRICSCVVATILAVPSLAQAQASVLDGIEALTRGDYASALRILRPLAEDAREPDPLAQFVMAALYHAGRGVAMNPDRACGLYLRAATPTNPLMSESIALAQTIHHDVPLLRKECEAASHGRWIDPPPASFALDNGHRVRIDDTGFVVTYAGTEKTAAMPLGGVGRVYLPSRHTRLDVSHPVKARRHFIEFFIWMPPRAMGTETWALTWVPFEIVGHDPRQFAGQGPVVIATADRPLTSFAVDDVVSLRVNAEGEAEWEVRGPNPRGGLIPLPEPR